MMHWMIYGGFGPKHYYNCALIISPIVIYSWPSQQFSCKNRKALDIFHEWTVTVSESILILLLPTNFPNPPVPLGTSIFMEWNNFANNSQPQTVRHLFSQKGKKLSLNLKSKFLGEGEKTELKTTCPPKKIKLKAKLNNLLFTFRIKIN